MFRWPIHLSPLSLGGDGRPRDGILEITPRGAVFTLASLTHVGHAAHLALVDAYLKGQVRLTATAAIGEDSRTLVASLAAPLLAAAELGVEHLTLGDLILLPRDLQAESAADLSANGRPTRSVDCARFLLRDGNGWHWVRGAEQFERAGCLGTTNVGAESLWHDVIAELPDTAEIKSGGVDGRWPVPIASEVRAPSAARSVSPDVRLVTGLRRLALARFGRSPLLTQSAIESIRAVTGDSGNAGPLVRADIISDIPAPSAEYRFGARTDDSPTDLGRILPRLLSGGQPAPGFFHSHGLKIDIALAPDPDGYQTLCLLPPADADASVIRPLMTDATRALLGGLIGRPLAEHRSDPLVLSLRSRDGDDRHVTTLHVGESIAIVRNQTVFAAWVGSDGRATVKLFPPGGMSPP